MKYQNIVLVIICLSALCFFQSAESPAQEKVETNIGDVFAVAFSPEGSQIAFGSTDKRVRVVEVETGKCLFVSPEHKSSVKFVEFIPKENRLLSITGDNTAYVWDIKSGEQIRSFDLGRGIFLDGVLLDGKILMNGRGESVYDFWDINTATLIRTIKQQNRSRDAFEYQSIFDVTPDGKTFLSRGAYKTDDKFRLLRLRTIAAGKDIRQIKLPKEDTAEVIKISSDGKTVLVGGNKISLWSLGSGELIRYISTLEKGTRDLAFSLDGTKIVSVGYGVGAEGIEKSPGSVYLWETETGKMLREFTGHNRPVNAVAFSPDGTKIVTGGNDSRQPSLRVWNTSTGNEIFCYPQNTKINLNVAAQRNR